MKEVRLGLDEYEALRLADKEGYYQEDAARRMNVSRQTFTRIVSSARRKVAEALVDGLALRLEGGNVRIVDMRRFHCPGCEYVWKVSGGRARPARCPQCGGGNLHLAKEDRGPGGNGGVLSCCGGSAASGGMRR